MKYLLESEQAKKIDEFSINKLGIPSIVLMENAARSAAEFIFKKINKSDKILIICGVGNNGGDGLAIARHLYNFSINNIDIVLIGNLDKQTNDNKINYNVLKNLNLNLVFINDESNIGEIKDEYNVIIDALLGIGAKNELKGLFSNLLKNINNFSGLKFAIDLPTGVDSNTGFADKNAFVADYTITMFSPKVGLFINEGKRKAGLVVDAYLGVSHLFLKEFSNNYIIEFEDLKTLIPKRRIESSKFDFGRILIIAGSQKYSGAAALAANACIKSGAGLVELFATKFHSSLLPEIIQLKGVTTNNGNLAYININLINEINEKYDVLAIGPGLSTDEESIKLAQDIIYNNLNRKLIIDADGLKAIIPNKKLSRNVLITPHIYEFINAFKLNKNEVINKPCYYAQLIAKEYQCNILLKGTPTIITNGNESFYNILGNSGMATAGSGDVLTGIVSYYSTQLDNQLLAGAIGAFIHSLSGDIFVKNYNKESLTASELINSLKEIRFE